MANRKITVEFLGRDTSLGRTSKQAGDNVGKLGGRLKTVAKVGAAGLAVGAIGAAGALVKMGKAAAEDQQSAALLAKQLKNSAGATKGQVAATERWITAQGRSKGVADDQLRPALANLVRATGDVGKAQKLGALAMDVSAGSGKDLGAISLALAKAQNGNVGALGRLGIATKDAEGKTKSFKEIQADLAKQFGGAATAKANTFQGKMDRLKLVMSETGEAIGMKLIPIVTKMADWFLKKGLPALSSFGNYMRDTFGPVIGKIKGIIDAVFGGGTGGAISGWVANITSIFNSAMSIWKSLWGIFGGTITTLVQAIFGNIKQVIGGALNVIAGIFKVISSVLKGDWKGAWDGIKQIVKGAWQMIKGIVNAGWNLVKAAFKAGGNAIKAVFGGIWNGVKSIAKKGIDTLVNAVKAVPGKIKALGGAMRSAGKAILQKLFDGLKSAGGMAGGVARAVWNAVKRLLNGLIGSLNRAIPNSIGPFNLPDNPIPRLAKGGIVKARPGGTLAILGEAGQDEAVIPLGGANAGRPSFNSNRGQQAAADMRPIIVQMVVDGKVLHQSLVKRKRETGVALGLA